MKQLVLASLTLALFSTSCGSKEKSETKDVVNMPNPVDEDANWVESEATILSAAFAGKETKFLIKFEYKGCEPVEHRFRTDFGHKICEPMADGMCDWTEIFERSPTLDTSCDKTITQEWEVHRQISSWEEVFYIKTKAGKFKVNLDGYPL